MKNLFLLFSLMCCFSLYAQDYFPTNSGVKTSSKTMVAFTNATIYVTSEKVVKKGTLLIADGKVIQVGTSVNLPRGTQIINLSGKSIYPSFIDIYSSFGIKKPKKSSVNYTKTQYEASRDGYYWNDHIRPDTNPIKSFSYDKKEALELIKAGFGVVNTHMEDGIIRGNGILVALNSNSTDAYRILDSKSAQYLSFSKSRCFKTSLS